MRSTHAFELATRARFWPGTALLCALLGTGACHRQQSQERAALKKSAEPPPQASPPSAEPAAPRTLATAGAFDLALGARGPLLVWAPGRATEAGLLLAELDALGAARAAPRAVASAENDDEVIEIAMATGANQVGIGWRESGSAGSRTRALLLPLGDADHARAPVAPVLLGSAPPDRTAARGRVALAGAEDGRVRALYATGPSECIESSVGPCTGFGFRELGSAAPARQEPWLSVPQPCAVGAATLAALRGHWYYGLCTWTGDTPTTTAYSIHMEPSYARADEVLRGCTPLGMTRIDAATVLLGGDCGPIRRAVRLTIDPSPPAELPLVDLALVCEQGHAVLRATGWALSLQAPRDRLEAVLPQALAPAGARAVWSGRALLIATPTPAGLELHVHSCQGGALRELRSAR
jgi:hypothetical protein